VKLYTIQIVDLQTSEVLGKSTLPLWTENARKIAELFPDVVIGGKIDFDRLHTELSGEILENRSEAYDFTWVGKQDAVRELHRSIDKTLRPVVDDSKNWETTENLYIEGDNLDVLKLVQESYLGKIKMVYIDPPYNTGKDFIYRDNWREKNDEYERKKGVRNEETGERLVKNAETDGRFHSDWCSMMYPRLKIARNLLSNDGVIFISIDDHEVANLRKICGEVFGEENFIAQFIWERSQARQNDAKYVSIGHDYVLMYAKRIDDFEIGRLPRTEKADSKYSNPDNDPRGPWQSDNMSVKTYSPTGDYSIETPSGRTIRPPSGKCWRFPKSKFLEKLRDNRIWFNSKGKPRIKRFLSELLKDGMTPTSILFYKNVGHTQESAQELKALFCGNKFFDNPKPLRLLQHLLTLANTKPDSIILDFFSGSATTAHAVMQLNAKDGSKRKFIMMQLPEKTGKSSEARKAGCQTIADIGKKRIRLAGEKIRTEYPEADFDCGFRVFRVDESNMKDVSLSPAETKQENLIALAENIKEDRTDLDLLYDVIIRLGLPLSLPHRKEIIGKNTIHMVNGNALVACFDHNVPETIIRKIAEVQPINVVFRDSSFADSAKKINGTEIFKTVSPHTNIKVL
jgi:adenine-specific DNA-methyltransferase